MSKAGTGTLQQFARYAVIGVGTNATGYLLYLALASYGVDPKLGATVSFVVFVLAGYVLNRGWTFAVTHSSRFSFFRYGIAYGSAYLVDIGGLYVLVDLKGYPHAITQAALIVLLAACLFLVQKFWVFRDRQLPGIAMGILDNG